MSVARIHAIAETAAIETVSRILPIAETPPPAIAKHGNRQTLNAWRGLATATEPYQVRECLVYAGALGVALILTHIGAENVQRIKVALREASRGR